MQPAVTGFGFMEHFNSIEIKELSGCPPYLDFVAVPHPLDGGHGEARDLALQPQVLLARHRHLLRLDLLDHLGRLRLPHHVEQRVQVRLPHRVLDQQRVLAVVLVAHLGDPADRRVSINVNVSNKISGWGWQLEIYRA